MDMRTLIVTLILGLGLFLGRFESTAEAQATASFAWSPSGSTLTAGYYLVWGTNSGQYFGTNTYLVPTTNGTISNLLLNVTYYVNVAAYALNGQVSPYAGELTFISNGTAPPPVTPPVTVDVAPPPPPPTLPGGSPGTAVGPGGLKPPPGASGAGHTASASSGSGSGSGTSGGSTPHAGSASPSITQAQIWGIPPVLKLAVTNAIPSLNIGGTVGATVMVQSTTNLASPFSWTTLTNVTLTNVAQVAGGPVPGQPQDAIDLAYVPAAQNTQLPAVGSAGNAQFFRIVMPYDYIVLAGQVLPPKGYSARLILINMPGLNDDACYVSQSSSFIHFVQTNSNLQLQGSGSTIRQIASTLAGSLNLDWTTASEFVYSNGVAQIMATVVEADPASSDPVAGTTPTSSIVIDF
jgi:hypothetical protein